MYKNLSAGVGNQMDTAQGLKDGCPYAQFFESTSEVQHSLPVCSLYAGNAECRHL